MSRTKLSLTVAATVALAAAAGVGVAYASDGVEDTDTSVVETETPSMDPSDDATEDESAEDESLEDEVEGEGANTWEFTNGNGETRYANPNAADGLARAEYVRDTAAPGEAGPASAHSAEHPAKPEQAEGHGKQ